jgi:hypothetical protein
VVKLRLSLFKGEGVGAALLILFSPPAIAQTVVTSAAPEKVAVTIYRDPNRSGGGEIDLEYLEGFALITETRTITVPEGQADIRFEGVAGGIVPVSAIVTGLPGGVVQKNRDARLLSPAALVDGSYGRILHLKRTNRKTGRVTEEDATLVSGPVGGVILKTKSGIEAMGCAGLPEKLGYDGLPPGLTAKPTLSVTTRSPHAATATVQLSYLASGFDWAANYVARVKPDGKTLDLFAWLTLANSNAESFVDANTQAVAGKVNRDENAVDRDPSPPPAYISLRCWPLDTTSTFPRWGLTVRADGSIAPPPMMAAPATMAMRMEESDAGENIVTASKRVELEDLGDLKLYRLPEQTTVAANAQKQVGLIEKQNVPFERIYTVRLYPGQTEEEPQMASILLRMMNKPEKGLGLPMPSGGVSVFEPGDHRELWVGDTRLRDTAVNEKVELTIGGSTDVRWTSTELDTSEKDDDRNIERYSVTLSNAKPQPVVAEILIDIDPSDQVISDASAKLGRKDGKPLWLAKIPANGTLTLKYAVRPVEEKEDN